MTAEEYLLDHTASVLWEEIARLKWHTWEVIEMMEKFQATQSLYAFKYTPGLGYYWITLSIHRTKKGAEMAMILHRHDCNGIEYPKNQHPDWKVEEITIKD
jgi:hypothetical protein